MTDSELYTTWGVALIAAALVVIIAAALLLVIIMTARSILHHAREAEATVARIADHTQPIWTLDQTNKVAGEIFDETRGINGQTGRIADALHRQPPGTGGSA